MLAVFLLLVRRPILSNSLIRASNARWMQALLGDATKLSLAYKNAERFWIVVLRPSFPAPSWGSPTTTTQWRMTASTTTLRVGSGNIGLEIVTLIVKWYKFIINAKRLCFYSKQNYHLYRKEAKNGHYIYPIIIEVGVNATGYFVKLAWLRIYINFEEQNWRHRLYF